MKYIIIFIICLIAFPAMGQLLPGYSSFGNKADTNEIVFTANQTAGAWYIDKAWKTSSVSFNHGGSLDADLYNCYTGDEDDDGELSDESNCQLITALNSDVNLTNVSLPRPGVWVEITTPESSSTPSYLYMKGSNLAGGGGGGSGISVSSWQELESVLRSFDIQDGSTTVTNNVVVKFSDGFTMDETSTTPFEINLPVGGGEHPQITIDFGGHVIVNQANPVIMVDFGNPNGTCTSNGRTAFISNIAGCAGVPHDYDVTIQNGMVTSEASYTSPVACTTLSNDCDRMLIETENADGLIYNNTRSVTYGGRVRFKNLKLGGMANNDINNVPSSDLLAFSLSFTGDSCLYLEEAFASIWIENVWSECYFGIRMQTPTAYAGITTPTQGGSNFEFHEWQHRTNPYPNSTRITCAGGGLFGMYLTQPTSFYQGDVTLRGCGVLGQLKGGFFDMKVMSKATPHPSLTASYLETGHPAEVIFFDNGTENDAFINGKIETYGFSQVQAWLRSDAVGNIHFKTHLDDIGIAGLYPAFYYTDADEATSSAINGFVMLTNSDAEFLGGAVFDFEFQDPITTDPASTHDGGSLVPWERIIDADIVAGTVFDNDYEFFKVRMGSRGERIVYGSSGDAGICVIGRDVDDGGDTACHFLNGSFTCEIDTNGVCNDAT